MRHINLNRQPRLQAIPLRPILLLLALLPLLALALPEVAFADTEPTGTVADDTCTSDFPRNEEQQEGLLTQIITYIKNVVDTATEQLFTGIITDSGFLAAVNAAFALFIAFFGAAFLFGIVPLTFGQALSRLLKMAVIVALINQGFPFFSEYVVTLFNDGTDELIDAVIGIAIGDDSDLSVAKDGTPQPFVKMEGVVGDVLSPEMMVSTITAFTTSAMGPAMGGLMGIGMVAFVQAIVKALRVYAISLVAKALLFGLAPIFISFILFERTKQIFTGWVNQIVNYSLQPILMFAFLSFFIILIESSVDNILATDICWTHYDHIQGTSTAPAFWRFTDQNGDPTGADFTWDGLASCIEGECPDFPISIIDILTFLILAHLAYRFSDVVVNIATEIASSTLFLDKLRSGLSEMINAASHREQGSTPPGSGRT